MIRVTVHFTGRVQGVNFRATTADIAERHEVAGYVRNLSDGRVRLVAEGEADQLHRFVEEVRRTMSRHLRDHTIERGEATGEFGRPEDPGTFTIQH